MEATPPQDGEGLMSEAAAPPQDAYGEGLMAEAAAPPQDDEGQMSEATAIHPAFLQTLSHRELIIPGNAQIHAVTCDVAGDTLMLTAGSTDFAETLHAYRVSEK